MVAEVRRGASMRSVALRYGTSLSMVQYWVQRAAGQRLDRVCWALPRGCGTPVNRTPTKVEDRVLQLRKRLREKSALGECGPQAIRQEMLARRCKNVPSVRTIARILERRGALDGQRRVRRPAPPRGWFLPEVAAGRVELDSFDIIEDLVIQGGIDVNVLTGISLHGALPAAWPQSQITAKFTVQALEERWREFGLPDFAKFDNDTVFQGPHHFSDTFGRVTRMCLSLNVTPVFAPPRETGFQADIESYNGRWKRCVWQRFKFTDLKAVQRQSALYVKACGRKCQARIQDAPPRRRFPKDWRLNLQAPLQGTVIFLRRTDPQGNAQLLGRSFLAASDWPHRLVRAEVDLTSHGIRFYALRRRDPDHHRYLSTHPYQPPTKPFKD
jgi:transposase-like protein